MHCLVSDWLTQHLTRPDLTRPDPVIVGPVTWFVLWLMVVVAAESRPWHICRERSRQRCCGQPECSKFPELVWADAAILWKLCTKLRTSWRLPAWNGEYCLLQADLCRWFFSLRFNSHFSRCTWVSQFQNVSILDFVGPKGDGGAGDNWSCKICEAPVKSLLPTYQHPTFYNLDVLPVTHPTVSKHWWNCGGGYFLFNKYPHSMHGSCELNFMLLARTVWCFRKVLGIYEWQRV